jgi:hypothetical protein
VVGDYLEMGKVGRFFGKKKVQYAIGKRHIEIKCSVDKLETSGPSLPQNLKLFEQFIQGKIAYFFIYRRETKFTLKRASTRRFDVDGTVGYVIITVSSVGHVDSF